MLQNNQKVDPFIEIPQTPILLPGEFLLPLNPYVLENAVLQPFYYVSNFGRFFSIASGRLRLKALQIGHGNYYQLDVATYQGQKHMFAHRGVLSTFYPRPDMYKLQVDHIDANHYNNNITNLRWVTAKQNIMYARQNGLVPDHSYSDDIIKYIMERVYNKYSDKDIAEELSNKNIKITPGTVKTIRTGNDKYKEKLKELNSEPVLYKQHFNLSEEDINKIEELFKSGYKPSEIARQLNISDSTVRHNILKMYGGAKERNQRVAIIPKESRETVYKYKKSPFVNMTKEQINEGIELYSMNVYVSKNHILNPYYAITKDGRIFSGSLDTWRELHVKETDKGYSVVKLVTNHGEKNFFVHRLVMATFCPTDDMYDLQVDHINGIRTDNRLENLRWVSYVDSRKVSDKVTRSLRRAPDEDIIRINELAWSGKTDPEIIEIMENKYSAKTIRFIRSGLRTYKPILERLNLKPFKYHKGAIDKEIRKEICDYINLMRTSSDKGIMDIFLDASAEFDYSVDTIKDVYYTDSKMQ